VDLFVTVFYCIFDPVSGRLEYANGGHNHPYLLRADGSIETLDGRGGIVLGVMPAAQYPNHQMQLRPGDRLVLYTDGVTEAFNGTQEAYGTERLLAVIRAHRNDDSTALVQHICQSVTTFAGSSPQSDDITLTVLRWSRSPGSELS
jgi:sigma-B regulation protein RsbU (phosphoserine phosphatase)